MEKVANLKILNFQKKNTWMSDIWLMQLSTESIVTNLKPLMGYFSHYRAIFQLIYFLVLINAF